MLGSEHFWASGGDPIKWPLDERFEEDEEVAHKLQIHAWQMVGGPHTEEGENIFCVIEQNLQAYFEVLGQSLVVDCLKLHSTYEKWKHFGCHQ